MNLSELKLGYKGRPVFITGADGFVGSHLTEILVSWGANVFVFVRATSSGELRNIVHLRKKIKVFRGDLRDRTSVDNAIKALKNYKNTIIFHLAGQAHVGESWERPYETLTTNILGTLNLLESIRENNVQIFKFDTAGTSEEYGNINHHMKDFYEFSKEGSVVLHEISPVNPKSLYATSKLAADFITTNYYDAYGIPALTTRMFNNYGPRQNPRYITGTVITQALMKDVIELGNLDTKRDFCYVIDGCYGHLCSALYGKPGEVYVYGQGKNSTILDWAELILKLGSDEGYWDNNKKIISVPSRYRPGTSDVKELLVDYSKIFNLCGWKPSYTWEDGILKTIKWYKENLNEWIGRIDWEAKSEVFAGNSRVLEYR